MESRGQLLTAVKIMAKEWSKGQKTKKDKSIEFSVRDESLERR